MKRIFVKSIKTNIGKSFLFVWYMQGMAEAQCDPEWCCCSFIALLNSDCILNSMTTTKLEYLCDFKFAASIWLELPNVVLKNSYSN